MEDRSFFRASDFIDFLVKKSIYGLRQLETGAAGTGHTLMQGPEIDESLKNRDFLNKQQDDLDSRTIPVFLRPRILEIEKSIHFILGK